MTETVTWDWAFPGGVWGLLGATLVSVFLVWGSYSRTLRLLTPLWRWTLTVLRSVLLAVLFVCLAAPKEVLTRSYKRSLHRPLAVLIDTSGSMVRPDSSGQTRLGLAKETLDRILAPSRGVMLFSFSDKLEPLTSLDALKAFQDQQKETHLLKSLRDVLSAAPAGGWGGVMALTDGGDTTSDDVESTGRLFRERQTPLLLAATETDLHQDDYVRIDRIDLQPVNITNTQYPLDVLVRSQSNTSAQVTVRVLQNDVSVGETTLVVTPGSHTQKVSFYFSQTKPGTQDYEVQLLPDSQGPPDTLYACTQIMERSVIPVLYYSGSLSVEYRYVRAAFADDPAIRIESAVHISATALRHQVMMGEPTRLHAENFPGTLEELNQFKVIVIADLLPEQLDDQQTSALLEYVKEGGGLIFIVSNSSVASQFSGSELEQLLPVVFEPNGSADSQDSQQAEANRLRDQLNQVGDAANSDDPNAINTTVANLQKMLITSDGRAVFGSLGTEPYESNPLLREYAAVQRAKPGAIVAAEHSQDSNKWGRRPLLAMEHFGEGRSAVLATDSIWRWQLSLPSTSQAYKKLWKQMLFWIANQSGDVPSVTLPVQKARAGDVVTVRVKIPPHLLVDSNNRPSLEVLSPNRTDVRKFDLTPGAEPNTYTASVPVEKGPWMRCVARVGDGPPGTAMVNVRDPLWTVEDEHLAPDVGLLKRLAEAAGGQVIDARSLRELPGIAVQSEDVVTERKVTNLWDNTLVFVVVLGLFCAELILRRSLKLL